MFEKGDKVMCINDRNHFRIESGGVYTVRLREIVQGVDAVRLRETESFWYSVDRFILNTPEERTKHMQKLMEKHNEGDTTNNRDQT